MLSRSWRCNKPGGLNKVAHNVSNTFKKAGRDTKAEVHRDASKTHDALKDAGNDTKTELKKVTGIKGSQSNQPGGLNKVAREISHTSKKAGSSLKHEKNKVKRINLIYCLQPRLDSEHFVSCFFS